MQPEFTDPLLDLEPHPDRPFHLNVTPQPNMTTSNHGLLRLRGRQRAGRADRYVDSEESHVHNTDHNPAPPWWARHLGVDGYRSEWRVWANVPRAYNPVVLIDGQPVSQGWGEGYVSLPFGWYRVEVQVGHAINTRMVRVRSGRTITMNFTASRHRSIREMFGRLHDSYMSSGLSIKRRPALARTYMYQLLLWTIIGLVVGVTLSTILAIRAGNLSMFLPITGFCLFLPLALRIGFYKGERAYDRQPSQLVPGRIPFRPRIMDPRLQKIQYLPIDESHLILDLNYYQLPIAEMARSTSPYRVPWIGPPRVWIDGVETFATWGRMAYTVSSGPHDVRIVAPLPDERLRSAGTKMLDMGNFDERHSINVTERFRVHLHSRCRVVAELDATGQQLEVYGADWQGADDRPA